MKLKTKACIAGHQVTKMLQVTLDDAMSNAIVI